MIPPETFRTLRSALPFWVSLGFVPLVWLGATQGGYWLILLPAYGWGAFTVLDFVTGLQLENPDVETPLRDLFWYRLITLIWFPVQIAVIFFALWWVSSTDTLNWFEAICLFFGIGVMSGVIGIVYSHELMHQRPKVERLLADLLLASVLYSHFRSEHMLVHHRYIGTPRDPVSARFNEGFQAYFYRVLRDCPRSAWRAEATMLARKGLPVRHISNPFWKYSALQLGFLALAYAVFGWAGVGLFIWQGFIAIWQLEMTNYVEHYGLTRRHLGDGKYEPVRPHHSWNAAHKASNWLMINLQRHSDHHYKPDRRFPLLQTYPASEAPQLPYGYPAMTTLALFPPLWRRAMNPKVRAWRRKFYADITDWQPYNDGTTPSPHGAD
jgi:alkane 1-monooxygenase